MSTYAPEIKRGNGFIAGKIIALNGGFSSKPCLNGDGLVIS